MDRTAPGVISDKGRPEMGEEGRLPQPVRSSADEISRPKELDRDTPVTEVSTLGVLLGRRANPVWLQLPLEKRLVLCPTCCKLFFHGSKDMSENEIGISVVDSVIRVDCSFFKLNADTVIERIREWLPVLERVLSADQAWHGLPDDLVGGFLHDRLRRDFIYQATVSQTLTAASLLFEVIPPELSDVSHNEPRSSNIDH
jgi:hypothetical protein